MTGHRLCLRQSMRLAIKNKEGLLLSRFRTLREDLLCLGRDVRRVRKRQGSVSMS